MSHTGQGLHLMQQVGVREGNALGLAGGARGVQNSGDGRASAGWCHGLLPGPGGEECLPTEHALLRFPLQLQHQSQTLALGRRQVQATPEIGVLHHQGSGVAVVKDVAKFLNRSRGATHRIGGPATHQALIRHQPAGAVFCKQGHHISFLHSLALKGSRRRGNPLGQFGEAETLRMGRMGGIDGGDGAVSFRQPRPDRINPLQLLNVAMALQGLLFTGRGHPAGGHPTR